MAQRGRKPTAKEIRKLMEEQPSYSETVAPDIKLTDLEPPGGLTARSKAVWDVVVPALNDHGILAQTDRNVLERYCDLKAKWDECRELVDEQGMFCANHLGKRVVNPAFVQYKHLLNELIRIERELGLTPASRTQNKKKDIPLKDLFSYN